MIGYFFHPPLSELEELDEVRLRFWMRQADFVASEIVSGSKGTSGR